MAPCDDAAFWNPGDGNDVVEGQTGTDQLSFAGANIAENLTVDKNGDRVRLSRDVANVSIDVSNVEFIQIQTLGGVDNLTVGPNLSALTTIIANLGPNDDGLTTVATSTVIADGGDANDVVFFDALDQPISASESAIAAGGLKRLTHTNFENVTLRNALGAPPTLTITSPPTDLTLLAATPFISLAGTAADDQGVTSVTWTTNHGASGTAAGTTTWKAENIPLVAGVNVFTVSALDVFGNRGDDVHHVTIATLTYTMAEGATGVFFDTDILLATRTACRPRWPSRT